MEIRLHNTLSNQTEPFVPQKPGEVSMYTCGPTVYDYAHIGNYRTFIFQDILRRFLKLRGFRLNHVMNLTDVDDRIIGNAADAVVDVGEVHDVVEAEAAELEEAAKDVLEDESAVVADVGVVVDRGAAGVHGD